MITKKSIFTKIKERLTESKNAFIKGMGGQEGVEKLKQKVIGKLQNAAAREIAKPINREISKNLKKIFK